MRTLFIADLNNKGYEHYSFNNGILQSLTTVEYEKLMTFLPYVDHTFDGFVDCQIQSLRHFIFMLFVVRKKTVILVDLNPQKLALLLLIRIFASSLIVFQHGRVRYIENSWRQRLYLRILDKISTTVFLSQAIEENVLKRIALRNSTVIPHPLFSELAVHRLKKSGVCFIGVCSAEKNMQAIEYLHSKQHSFAILGSYLGACTNLNVLSDLDATKFSITLDKFKISVFDYSNDAYRYRSSGAVFNAINANHIIIYNRSCEYIHGILENYPYKHSYKSYAEMEHHILKSHDSVVKLEKIDEFKLFWKSKTINLLKELICR